MKINEKLCVDTVTLASIEKFDSCLDSDKDKKFGILLKFKTDKRSHSIYFSEEEDRDDCFECIYDAYVEEYADNLIYYNLFDSLYLQFKEHPLTRKNNTNVTNTL